MDDKVVWQGRAEEGSDSRSLVIFEEVEEEESSLSSDEEDSLKEDASSGEHARKSTSSIQTLIDWTGIKLRYFSLFSPYFLIYHNLIISVQGN